MSNGSDTKPGNPAAQRIQEAVIRMEEDQVASAPPEQFPEPLKLGPQAYVDPRVWGPKNGLPLDDDPAYQAALKIQASLGSFDPDGGQPQ